MREAASEESLDRRQAHTPPIDIHEGPEGLTLEADLPGATERNLRVELEDNVLSLYVRIDASAPRQTRDSCTKNIAWAIITGRSS